MEQLITYIKLFSHLSKYSEIPSDFGLRCDADGWYLLRDRYMDCVDQMVDKNDAGVWENFDSRMNIYMYLDKLISMITGINQIKVKYSSDVIHWWSWNGFMYTGVNNLG